MQTLSATSCIILARVNIVPVEPPVASVQQSKAEWNCIPISSSSQSNRTSVITSNISSSTLRNLSSHTGPGIVWSPSARIRLAGAAGAGMSGATGSGNVSSPGYPHGITPALHCSLELVPAANSLTERVELEFTSVDLGQPGLPNVNDKCALSSSLLQSQHRLFYLYT